MTHQIPPWLELECVEPQTIQYTRTAFATTKRANKVSKESVLCGSDHIGVKGRTIIEAGSVIRGDLATIELGSYCVIARGAVIRPPEQHARSGSSSSQRASSSASASAAGSSSQAAASVSYIPMTIGDHVIIEENSIIEAAAIGDAVHIGKNVIVGPRCIISSCCEILDDSVLAPNTVTAPFSIWSGVPAVATGRLPESYQLVWQEHTRQFYSHFQPNAPVASATSSVAPSAAASRRATMDASTLSVPIRSASAATGAPGSATATTPTSATSAR